MNTSEIGHVFHADAEGSVLDRLVDTLKRVDRDCPDLQWLSAALRLVDNLDDALSQNGVSFVNAEVAGLEADIDVLGVAVDRDIIVDLGKEVFVSAGTHGQSRQCFEVSGCVLL